MTHMVTNLTTTNVKLIGMERWEIEDFSDDGARFRMFRYADDLKISITKLEGEIFLCIRPTINFPFTDWMKTEEYRLCDKYNGIITAFDLYELKDDCDKVLKKAREMNEAFEKEEIDVNPLLERLTFESSDVFSTLFTLRHFNWWKATNVHEVEMFYRDYKRIERLLDTINMRKKAIMDNTADKIHIKEDINRYNEYGSIYVDLINKCGRYYFMFKDVFELFEKKDK